MKRHGDNLCQTSTFVDWVARNRSKCPSLHSTLLLKVPGSSFALKMLRFFIFVLLVLSIHQDLAAPPTTKPPSNKRIIKTKSILGHREVNWCVTGYDEPELHEWPLSQLTPLLRRDRRYKINNPKEFRYRIEFKEIYSRQTINAEVICNTTTNGMLTLDPWCIPLSDCGPDVKYCRHPPYKVPYMKYVSRLFKYVHVMVFAEKRRDPREGIYEMWEPFELQGMVLQANHNPKGIGLPTGQFFIDDEFECNDCKRKDWGRIVPCRKRSVLESVHPTVLVYHHEMAQMDDDQNHIKPAGTRSEVHGNFRWWSAPCLETRRLEFYLLAVHDFKTSVYDVVKLGPYEAHSRGHSYHTESLPTPIFRGFFHHQEMYGTWCHAASARDIQVVHPPVFNPMEMSPGVDLCTRKEENPRRTEIGEIFEYLYEFMCFEPDQPVCSPLMIDNGEHAYTLQQSPDALRCSEIKCPEPYVPVIPVTTEGPPPIFKRHYHGGILIMTNFCLIPINTFIARFYKETLNLDNYKGVKMWFWWHLLGMMACCILIYFGTFIEGPDQGHIAHVYLGRVYILLLATCYFTSWGRNKHHWLNLTVEFVHGCLGYLTIILAHITMHHAPGVGFVPKLLVDLQICLHCLFAIVMTVHVCMLDSKFGMRPRRRHFPTVQARFDDIPVPQSQFREILLALLAVTTFALSLTALFIQ